MNDASEQTSGRERDPVCGMSVRVDLAIGDGLTTTYEGHAYYFCRPGCRDAFAADPSQYIASHGHAAEHASTSAPTIDEGMRRWYDSCSCCLSDAYPDVKAALDAERASNSEPMADAGICEVAEAAEAETANA